MPHVDNTLAGILGKVNQLPNEIDTISLRALIATLPSLIEIIESLEPEQQDAVTCVTEELGTYLISLRERVESGNKKAIESELINLRQIKRDYETTVDFCRKEGKAAEVYDGSTLIYLKALELKGGYSSDGEMMLLYTPSWFSRFPEYELERIKEHEERLVRLLRKERK